MIDRTSAKDRGSADRLAELMEQITTRMQADDRVDIDSYVESYPEYARELLELVPTLEALNSLPTPNLDELAPESDRRPLTDWILGDYRVRREIGRGGMGIVYEAEQLSLKRRVALKVLPLASMLDQRRLGRFKNEAQAAASLDHPNIVHVYSVGVERGVHYYAMQYVDGRSLSELVDAVVRDRMRGGDGTLEGDAADKSHANGRSSVANPAFSTTEANEPAQAPSAADTQPLAKLSTDYASNRSGYFRMIAGWLRQAAEAVHYAHQMGVVHRDIKPANLMLDANGDISITDFGLASSLRESPLTATGDLIGTLRYMSREQAAGDTAVVDHRTDVYSLGVTLYELVCLRPAFDGSNRERLLKRVLDEQPVAPRKHDPSIPRDLETIVLKAISKDPTSRYRTALDFARDLGRFVDREPIRARRASRTEYVKSWVRRNPLIASLTAAVASLLLTLTVGAAWSSLNLHQKNEEIAQRLYVADMNRAQSAIDQGEYLEAETLLLRHVPRLESDDLRGFEWFHLWDRCHRSVPEHTLDHGLGTYGVSYSPDGKTLAVAQFNGSVHLWDTATGRELTRLRAHSQLATAVEFSDDGRMLITGGRDGKLCFWDLETGKLVKFLSVSKPLETVNDIELSPGGKLVAVGIGTIGVGYPAGKPARVRVWNLEPETTVMQFNGLTGKATLAFSPDGGRLVAGGFDGKLHVWNTLDWQLDRVVPAHDACIRDIAFSPDRKMLATASGIWRDRFVVGQIKLWDPATWTERQSLHNHRGDVRCLGFSPDGRLLAAGSEDRQVSIYDLVDNTFVNQFVAHAGVVWDLQFSPDGTSLCSTSLDNTARIWSSATIRKRSPGNVRYDGHDNMIWQVTLDKSGTTVLSADADGMVHAWDIASGRKRFSLGPME